MVVSALLQLLNVAVYAADLCLFTPEVSLRQGRVEEGWYKPGMHTTAHQQSRKGCEKSYFSFGRFHHEHTHHFPLEGCWGLDCGAGLSLCCCSSKPLQFCFYLFDSLYAEGVWGVAEGVIELLRKFLGSNGPRKMMQQLVHGGSGVNRR